MLLTKELLQQKCKHIDFDYHCVLIFKDKQDIKTILDVKNHLYTIQGMIKKVLNKDEDLEAYKADKIKQGMLKQNINKLEINNEIYYACIVDDIYKENIHINE